MSEYKPITQGLREAMNSDGWATNGTYCVKSSADMDEFNGLCDDIDALHKSLEQECEKLREKVDNQRKQLTEIQDAMHRRNMSAEIPVLNAETPVLNANKAPDSEFYVMECALTVEHIETVGNATSERRSELQGFLSKEVLESALDMMRQVIAS